jgi:hypothetical protein
LAGEPQRAAPRLASRRNGNWETGGICQRPEGAGVVDEYDGVMMLVNHLMRPECGHEGRCTPRRAISG